MSRAERWSAAALTVLALGIVAQRLHTWDEPLDRDVTTYTVIARGLLEGRSLYADLWDHKPPGIFWTYAIAQGIAGQGPLPVFLLGITAALATLVGVYRVGSAGSGGAAAGILAAAVFTAVASDLHLEANQPNTEAFLNACGIWILALLVRARSGLELREALACGLLLGGAVLFKLVAVVWTLPVALQLVWTARAGAVGRRRAAHAALGFAAAAMVLPGATILGFGAAGSFGDFWDAVVRFNRFYAGSPLLNVLVGLHPRLLFPPALSGVVPLVAAASVLPFVCRWRPPSRRILLLVCYGLCSWVAVGLPGRFFPHYYQLLLPPLAVAAAWSMTGLARSPASMRVGVAGAMVLLAALVALQLPSYGLPAERWSQIKYGDVFLRTRDVGLWIAQVLRPGEHVYQWGKETGIYHYADRLPPSGVFFEGPLLSGPFTASLGERLLRDLRLEPPELFVVTGNLPPDHAVFLWMAEHYAPLKGAEAFLPYVLYYRTRGELAARLAAGASRADPARAGTSSR